MIRALYNFCWYAVGTIILLAAILVTIVRLLLPDIGNYREDVQAWVSQYMGYPVAIQSIHADWRGWTPQLYLDDVTLMSPDGERPIAEFDNAYISFHPLRSLYYRQVIPESLVISGVRLQLMRLEDGSILATHPGMVPEYHEALLADDELIKWLLSQPIVELQDARIDWLDMRHAHRPVTLNNARLLLRTDRERTQISGAADLARQLGERIEFAFDLEGDLLGDDWHGHMYMQGKELLLANWPVPSRWRGIEIGAGRSNLEIWTDWHDATLHSMTGNVGGNDLLLLGNDNSNLIHSFTGNFIMRRNESGQQWHLFASIRELSTHHGIWPNTRIELKYDTDHKTLSGYTDFLRIEDLMPLIADDDILAPLHLIAGQVAIAGDMESVHFQGYPGNGHWHAMADFHDLSISDSGHRRSVTGLSGHVEAVNSRGSISLDSNSIRITDPDLYAQPMTGMFAEGKLAWVISDNSLTLSSTDMKLQFSDLLLQLSGKLHIDEQNGVMADLLASTRSSTDVETLKSLVPLTASDEFRKWVDRALVGGRLDYADMVLRGDPALIPFEQHEGQLKIHAKFDDVTLDYHPEWPPIYHLEADLVITRNRLTANIPAGRVYDARIHNTTALIDPAFMENSTLLVTGHVEGGARDALKFLNESPLRDHDQLRRVREARVDGDIALMLDMQIPLSPEPNEITGKLELFGNNLSSPDPELDLSDVNGIVHFTTDSIETEELRGKFHGEDVRLGILRRGEAMDDPTIMRISGTADSRLISDVFAEYLPEHEGYLDIMMDHLSGRTNWDVEIHTRPTHRNVDTLQFSSDLRGLAVELPQPLGKAAADSRQFRLLLTMAESGEVLKQARLDYGDTLQVITEDQHTSLYFGPDQPGRVDRTALLTVRGSMPDLYLDDWFNLLTDQPELPADWRNILPDVRSVHVDVGIDNFVMYQQQYPDSHIKMNRQREADWHVSVTGPDMEGTISIPDRLEKQEQVVARFDRLYLKPLDTDSERLQLDPRNLPAFNIEVTDFVYGKTALGSLALNAKKTPNGLLISDFMSRTDGLQINGRGDWHAVNNEIVSDFELELHAARFADMLKAFGYSVIAIDDGETEIEISAKWPGAPTDFSLADINGSLSLGISKGKFLDIDPRAGRLFGLLSIQALPRRLSLDFADLFGTGLSFDRISGSYDIREGHAYTNDLFMEGISSKVAISGRIGLVDQDYDQIVTVTPHLSDTLPLAGALFGPAGIGIGAIIFLAGQVFEAIPDQIDKMMSFQYSMTGSWQDPVIEPYPPRELNDRPQELGKLH